MAELQRAFSLTDGIAAAERTPLDTEAMYASPQELQMLYGCLVTEADIRAAMSIISAQCNRPSLWPTEYELTLQVPSDRNETRIPITPVIKILEASGLYTHGRRDRQSWNMQQMGYATMLLIHGSRPSYTPILADTIDLDSATGVVRLPYALFAGYGTVKLKFIAGYAEIPDRVLLALYMIITEFHTRQSSSRIQLSVGRVTQRFESGGFVTPQIQALLEPFVVRGLY